MRNPGPYRYHSWSLYRGKSRKQRERRALSRMTGDVSFSHFRRPDQNIWCPTRSNSVGNHWPFHPAPKIVNGSSTQRQGRTFRIPYGRSPRWHAQVIWPRKGCRRKGRCRALAVVCKNFTNPPVRDSIWLVPDEYTKTSLPIRFSKLLSNGLWLGVEPR